MSFQEFNSIKLVGQAGEGIVTNETFGLRSLSRQSKAFIQQGLMLYRDNYLRYSGISGKKRSDYQRELHNAKTQSTQDVLKTLRRVKHDVMDDNKKHREFTWRNCQSQQLNTEAVWQQLENATTDELTRTQLRERHQQLKVTGHFLHYHPQALLDVYTVLQRLQQFFQQALVELEARKKDRRWFQQPIPDAFYAAYYTYLTQQLRIGQIEYQRLTQAMLERLQLAARSHSLRRCDVLLATVAELKQRGVIKPEYATTITPQPPLTVELFHRYHQAIDVHGDKKTRNQLAALPWFSSGPNVLSTQEKNKIINATRRCRQRLATRFGVVHLIPKAPRWPAFLFVGTNIRYHFFDDFFAIASFDATLQQARNTAHHVTVTSKILPSFTVRMQNAWRALQQEYQRLDNAYSQINRWPWHWLNDKTFQLLKRYRAKLHQQATYWFETYIDKLEQLAGSITENVFAPQRVLTYDEKQQIKATVTLVEEHLTSLPGLQPTLHQRLLSAKTAITTAMHQHDERILNVQRQQQQCVIQTTLLAPFQQACLEQPVSLDDVNKLVAYVQHMKCTHAMVNQDFLITVASLVNKACQQCERLLVPRYKPTSHVHQSFVQHAITQGKLIQALGKPSERTTLDAQCVTFAFVYVTRWSNQGVNKQKALTLAEHHALSELQEPIIVALGDKALTAAIKKLQTLRVNAQYNELGYQALQLKKQLEHRVIHRMLLTEFKRLDTTLFSYLKREPSLNLSVHGLQYLTELCDRLADARIQDVTTCKTLTPTDKAFLGMTSSGWWDTFTESVESVFPLPHTSSRQTLIAVVNCCTTLRMEARRLAYLSVREQAKLVTALKARIEKTIARYALPDLQRIVEGVSCFHKTPLPSGQLRSHSTGGTPCMK